MRFAMFILLALTALAASAKDKTEVETNFILGGVLGDGSLGFEEPWSEAVFGVEYSVLKGGELQREFIVRFGYSPTDKTFEEADSGRLTIRWLEVLGRGFLLDVALQGSTTQATTYEKSPLRGEFGIAYQLHMSRIGLKGVLPLDDPNSLYAYGITTETALARPSNSRRSWREFRFVFTTEILVARFEKDDKTKMDDFSYKVGIILRL